MKTTRNLLALLLALCLLLGGLPVLAEEVTVGDIEGSSGTGLSAQVDLGGYTYTVDGQNEVRGEGTSSVTFNVGEINEKVTGPQEDMYQVVGLDALTDGASSELTINTGEINASADDEQSVRGITAYSEGTLNISTDRINVDSGNFADGIVVSGGDGDVTINAGDVTATSHDGDADGLTITDYFCGDAKINTGEVNAISTDGSAWGLYIEPEDSKVAVNTEDITATGTGDGYGVFVYNEYGADVAVTVDGDVTASGNRTAGVSVHNESDTTVQVEGAVHSTADEKESTGIVVYTGSDVKTLVTAGDGVTAEGKGETNGIKASTEKDGVTTVAVSGDVIATGEKSAGLSLYNYAGGNADVLVDGTLSGEERAIKAYSSRKTDYDSYEYNPQEANIYVWKADEKNGLIAGVYAREEEEKEGEIIDGEGREKTIYWTDVKETLDQEASEAFEKDIWYIVKVQDSFASVLKAKGTSTYATAEKTYDVAHQDDAVTLNFTVAEGEVLEGIQYNEEKAAEYTKNEDGSYTVKMLRGGAMKLGLKLHKHTPAAAVNENVVAPTCTKDGSHDEVVYCSECKAELSRKAVTDKATGHKAGEAVIEKAVAPTCTKDGGHDEVVYCSVCKEELSRKAVTDAAIGHKAGEAVKENEVAPTCAKEGSYDEVVYCTVCKEELSRTKKTVEKLAHTPAAAARENEVAATTSAKGSYDLVIYCTVCNEELSREKVETPKLKKQDEDEAEPMPALVTELVYEPVSEDTEVNGVKASDALPMAEALETVGEALEGDDVSVTIPGVEKVLNAEEMARFDKLPVKERLLVTLSALGFADAVEADSEGLSGEGKALAEDVTARIESLSEAEKQALLDTIAAQFPKGTVTVDGKSCESFSIDVVTERNGEKSYNRYTFYNDGGKWVLYGVEVGQYREAEA